jgi:hypothetical protein
MKTKRTEKPTAEQLKKLHDAADAARERVSGYSDERRAELEAHALSKVHHAPSKAVCGA